MNIWTSKNASGANSDTSKLAYKGCMAVIASAECTSNKKGLLHTYSKLKKEGNLMSHIKFVLAWVQLGIIFFHSLGWLKFIGSYIAAGLVFWSPLELFIILWITDAFLYIFLVDKGKHFKD